MAEEAKLSSLSPADAYRAFKDQYKSKAVRRRRTKKSGDGAAEVVKVLVELAPTIGKVLTAIVSQAGPILKDFFAARRKRKEEQRKKDQEEKAKEEKDAAPKSGGATSQASSADTTEIDAQALIKSLGGIKEPKSTLDIWRKAFTLAKTVLVSKLGGTPHRDLIISKYLRSLKDNTMGPMAAAMSAPAPNDSIMEKRGGGIAVTAAMALIPIIAGAIAKAIAKRKAAKKAKAEGGAAPKCGGGEGGDDEDNGDFEEYDRYIFPKGEVEDLRNAQRWYTEQAMAPTPEGFFARDILPKDKLSDLVDMASEELGKKGYGPAAKRVKSVARRMRMEPIEALTMKGLTPEERMRAFNLKLGSAMDKRLTKQIRRFKKGLLSNDGDR